MAKDAARRHVARTLEARFAPVFWLETRLALRPDEAPDETWAALDTLDRLLSRAGFGWIDSGPKERARMKSNPSARNQWLSARWEIPLDNPVVANLPRPELRLAYVVDSVAHGLTFPRRGAPGERVSLLAALSGMDRQQRRDLLQWVQAAPTFAAKIVVDGRTAGLRPDPRDLRTCMWVLAAELIAGGWTIRRCAAPACGRYIGQWTKRERLFCDEGCRTAYHNARRAKPSNGG